MQGTFTDPRDGKIYKTVKIGKQVWMAQNLAYEIAGCKCYDNKKINCQKYGLFYDWETAMSVCPPGWHLPSKKEWEILVDFVGGKKIAGRRLKAKNGWEAWEKEGLGKNDGNGADDFGFNALPSGYCDSSVCHHDEFLGMGRDENWWSSSKKMLCLGLNYKLDSTDWFRTEKNYLLLSVRCLKNCEEEKYA